MYIWQIVVAALGFDQTGCPMARRISNVDTKSFSFLKKISKNKYLFYNKYAFLYIAIIEIQSLFMPS